MYTNILNNLESELKEVERQKRNELNNYCYDRLDYYNKQIISIEKKIDKIKDAKGKTNQQIADEF